MYRWFVKLSLPKTAIPDSTQSEATRALRTCCAASVFRHSSTGLQRGKPGGANGVP